MNKQLKQSLSRAVNQLPHPEGEALWAKPVTPMAEHDYITRQEPIRPGATQKRRIQAFAGALACLCLFVLGGVGWYGQNVAIATVVDLDVNPSIEITASRRDKVLAVTPQNEEGVLLLAGTQYRGWSLEDTVVALTDDLKRAGYLSQSKNAVLLTVAGKDAAHSQMLAQELSGKIRMTADQALVPTTVLRQTAPLDNDLREEAKRQKVSQGKLRLATDLAAILTQYSVGQLLSLPIETLLEVVVLLEGDAPGSIVVDESRFETSTEEIAPPTQAQPTPTATPMATAVPTSPPATPAPTTPTTPAPINPARPPAEATNPTPSAAPTPTPTPAPTPTSSAEPTPTQPPLEKDDDDANDDNADDDDVNDDSADDDDSDNDNADDDDADNDNANDHDADNDNANDHDADNDSADDDDADNDSADDDDADNDSANDHDANDDSTDDDNSDDDIER